MKKLSLLKKLGLSAVIVAAVAPLVVTATSCSNKNEIVTRYASFKELHQQMTDMKQLDCLKTGHFSYEQLLLGTKKFHKGNYILFVGSSLNDNTKKFFTNNTNSSDIELWFSDYVYESIWYNDIISLPIEILNKIEDDFGLVAYLDDFNSLDYKFYDEDKHEIHISENATAGDMGLITNISPFKKWTTEIINQTKKANQMYFDYEWDDESVTTDDYIRQDDQAKSYRALCELGTKFFPVIEEKRPKTFDVSENCNPVMAIYQNGRLMEIQDLPTKLGEAKEDNKDTTTLFGAINKYFTVQEEEEEK